MLFSMIFICWSVNYSLSVASELACWWWWEHVNIPNTTWVAFHCCACCSAWQLEMCLLCNVVKVYAKLVHERLHAVWRSVLQKWTWHDIANMRPITSQMQMVLSHDNSIIVSNGQQPPGTSAQHYSTIRLCALESWLLASLIYQTEPKKEKK